MKLLYNTGVLGYRLLAKSLSSFNLKAKQFTKGRSNIYKQIPESWKKDHRKVIHFHAASLGEFEQARPVIEKFKEIFTDYKILLTFFSPSGYEVRKDYSLADYVCYLPYDTPSEAEKFTKTFNPTISFFVKYEFWYHISKALHQNGTKLISFSSIFRPTQSFFKWYGIDTRATLRMFDYFFVQNDVSKELLNSISLKNVTVTGDSRFDRVYELCQNPKPLPEIKNFVNGTPCFVIGSSWKEDLAIILPFLNQFKAPLKTIIAPHNIKEEDLLYIEQHCKKSTIRYSQLNDSQEHDVLIIDNMGMLSSVYQFATICHIGGAFKTGLHNTLEAATYGKPITIGPDYRKFDEAVELVDLGVCYSVTSNSEFEQQFTSLYQNKEARINISKKLDSYIQQNIGASDAIISYCKENILKEATSSSQKPVS